MEIKPRVVRKRGASFWRRIPWNWPGTQNSRDGTGLESIMLAAVAVGLPMWFYLKSSKDSTTVRKLRRAFKEICLNPKSTLDDERCRQLAVGAMYASQQGAWQIRRKRESSTCYPKFWATQGHRLRRGGLRAVGLPLRKGIPLLLALRGAGGLSISTTGTGRMPLPGGGWPRRGLRHSNSQLEISGPSTSLCRAASSPRKRSSGAAA